MPIWEVAQHNAVPVHFKRCALVRDREGANMRKFTKMRSSYYGSGGGSARNFHFVYSYR